MAIQPIRLFGDPVLRKPAVEVVDFDKELRTLVADLTDTMLDAPGAGLAAPQIGVGLRVFTWNVDGEVGHLVNPVARAVARRSRTARRAACRCPSSPTTASRALSVVARGFDMHGEPGDDRGLRAAGPRASSTRPTTSTACCSSTGSTAPPARRR